MAIIVQSYTLPDGIDIDCILTNGAPHVFHARTDTVDLQSFVDAAEADLLATQTANTLEQAKQEKYAQIDADYNTNLSSGININGIILKATVDAQNEFTKGLVALSLIRDLGQYDDNTMMSVYGLTAIDYNGEPHDMTALQFKQLCAVYLQGIGTLRKTYLSRISAVNTATTIDELAVI